MKKSITTRRSLLSYYTAVATVAAICLSLTTNALAHAAALQPRVCSVQKADAMKDYPPDQDWNQLQRQLQFFAKLRELGVDPAAIVSAQALDRPGFELPKRATADLLQQALRNLVRPYTPPVADDQVLPVGTVNLPLGVVSSGIVISGGTGAGKTTAILRIIDYCLGKGIKSHFWDYKGESRRFHQFWTQAMVFSPQTAPWQWMRPPAGCDPLNYFIGVIAELRNEFEIRSETFPLAYSAYERVVRGLRPGDPFPSWSDFRRVLEHEAAAQNRENLFTLARVFQSVETVLGPNARVRVAPDIAERYPIVAYDLTGLDPALIRLFLGLHFNRMLHEAQQHEHTTGLHCLEIIDEAGPIGSIELVLRTTGTLSSVKRFATMSRFTGTGLILAGLPLFEP
jgi:hypothetical protein